MGGCVSLPKDHARKHSRRSRSFRTSFKGLPPDEATQESNDQSNDNSSERKTLARILKEERESKQQQQHSYQQSLGSKEEAWFDAEARFASDSDDEYLSVFGDATPSAGNSLNLPQSGPVTPRPTFTTLKDVMLKADTVSPINVNGRASLSNGVEEHAPTSKLYPEDDKKNSTSFASVIKKQNLLDATPRNSSVSVAPVSDGSTELEMGKYGNQKSECEGCLPCLLNTVVSFEKKSPQRRKSFRLFSFKRRSSFDLTDIPHLQDMPKVLNRPLAGSQVPVSDDFLEGTWSRVNPSTFKLRSNNYMKDRKKQFASSMSIFDAVGMDVFLSSRKIDHIARFVEMSHFLGNDSQTGNEKFPALLVFNIQVPMYSASVFPAESNGEGLSLVFYYRLSEAFKKEGPSYLKDMLMKLLEDEHEKVRGLVGETIVPFRERLKIVARVCNPEEIHLSAAERKLVTTYNEKPVLSRPQHVFYKGPNYFEIDLDVHRFNFIARKAVESFRERLKLCVLDIGLTIQGNKPEELPEYMLCAARLNKLNVGNFKYLNTEEDALSPEGKNNLHPVPVMIWQQMMANGNNNSLSRTADWMVKLQRRICMLWNKWLQLSRAKLDPPCLSRAVHVVMA